MFDKFNIISYVYFCTIYAATFNLSNKLIKQLYIILCNYYIRQVNCMNYYCSCEEQDTKSSITMLEQRREASRTESRRGVSMRNPDRGRSFIFASRLKNWSTVSEHPTNFCLCLATCNLRPTFRSDLWSPYNSISICLRRILDFLNERA